MNMQNNYKDAAQSAFKELEQRYNDLLEAGELSEAQKSEYGVKIDASVSRNNIYATQFHPEKSGEIGLEILKNFNKIASK